MKNHHHYLLNDILTLGGSENRAIRSIVQLGLWAREFLWPLCSWKGKSLISRGKDDEGRSKLHLERTRALCTGWLYFGQQIDFRSFRKILLLLAYVEAILSFHIEITLTKCLAVYHAKHPLR